MAKKEIPAAPALETQGGDEAPVNLGTLTEQPAVNREPVQVELADGTLRTDY